MTRKAQSDQSVRDYVREFVLFRGFRTWLFQAASPVVLLIRRDSGETKKALKVELEADLQTWLGSLGISDRRYERFARKRIRAALDGGDGSEEIGELITIKLEQLNLAIRGAPPGIEKARAYLLGCIDGDTRGLLPNQILDVFVLLCDDISPAKLEERVSEWKAEWRAHHEQEKAGRSVLPSEIFWSSLDDRGGLDAISRYRFFEHYGLVEFSPVFREVEGVLAESMIESVLGLDLFASEGGRRPWIRSSALHLWLISRSRELPIRLKDFVGITVRGIANAQTRNGWWVHPTAQQIVRNPFNQEDRHEDVPDPYLTALCSLTLLKLSASAEHHAQARRGLEALLSEQNEDGSWSSVVGYELQFRTEPDLLTTLLIAEALVRSGLLHIDRLVEKAVEWVLAQQDEFGAWQHEFLSEALMTVLVLEFFAERQVQAVELSNTMQVARGFLRRASELALDDSDDARQVAITTAYNGMESFLYALFDLPDIGINYWDGDRTIGVRRALPKLQEHLQQTRHLKRSQNLSHRNSLYRLAELRDDVVHRGMRITGQDAEHLVAEARAFVSEYSTLVVGRDLLAT